MGVNTATPPLKTLYLYLTAGCNCACSHCWIVPQRHSEGSGQHDMLDGGLLQQAIEQALPLGLAALKWTGGEPTLHPEFESFLLMQKQYGLSGVIETNGMLVSGQMAELMQETGIDQVSVSLDSANEAIHDSIRGVAGGFKRTVSGIKALVSVGYHPELILTLQRCNFDRLPEFYRLAEDLGAGSVKLNILQPVLRGASLAAGGQALSLKEILKLGRDIYNDHSRWCSLPVRLDLPMAFRPLSRIISGEHNSACNIVNIIGVLPRGEYALCGVGQHVPELALGAIESTNLQATWSSHPVLQKVREGLPKRLNGICARCLMNKTCLASCVAANYQLSGDLFAAYWFCAQAEREGLFPETRLYDEKT